MPGQECEKAAQVCCGYESEEISKYYYIKSLIMGYRISLYRCPKKDVDEIRNITNEDVEKSEWDVFDVLEKEQIKYDTLAHVLDTGDEEKNNLCSRIFTNRLDAEVDQSFYTISKEQLLNIIEYIRKNNIYDYMMSHTVDYDKGIIGDAITGKYSWEKPSWEEAVRKVCLDARFDARLWADGWKDDDGTMHYMNIDVSDNKWWISDGMSYRYVIFNFVHILKCFDWENDYLVAIGG